MLGQSLNDRASTSTSQAFSSSEREARGSQPGDLVDSLIENRIVLEKVKILESKMRYQIQKLVRLAEESPTEHVTNGASQCQGRTTTSFKYLFFPQIPLPSDPTLRR